MVAKMFLVFCLNVLPNQTFNQKKLIFDLYMIDLRSLLKLFQSYQTEHSFHTKIQSLQVLCPTYHH